MTLDQARQLLGAPSELGTRLTTRKSTILQREVPLGADCIIYFRKAAKTDAVWPRPGPCGRMAPAWAAELADTRWCGSPNNQEAYDAECAALVRALNLAADSQQRK